MLRTIVCSAFAIGTLGISIACGAESIDLNYYLPRVNCDLVERNKGITLRVIDRIVPLPKEFEFRGFHADAAAFTHTDVETGASIDVYYTKYDGAGIEEEDVRIIEWNGLEISYSQREGGRVARTVSHVAALTDGSHALIFGSTHPRLLAEAIACAR